MSENHNEDHKTGRAGLIGLARRLIELWALSGSVVLLTIVLMTSWSVFASAVFGRPFPGDFELTEIGIAVAAFTFLPYCQLTGANVTADIFTSGASARTIAFLTLLASIIALGFAVLLFWRMSEGLVDYQKYRETTAILQIPLWYGFVPILMSLMLLVVAALVTLIDAVRDIRDIDLNRSIR